MQQVDNDMSMVSSKVIISNKLGLHARPAMQFVDIANQYNCKVQVHKRGEDPCSVDGKSIFQMMTIAAFEGTELQIDAEGDDAAAAVADLVALVHSKFGETE